MTQKLTTFNFAPSLARLRVLAELCLCKYLSLSLYPFCVDYSMDKLIRKIPGSTATKAFVVSLTVAGLCAVPVFRTSESRQGHDLFSQDKPEVVASGQERLRKQARQQKKVEAS